MTDRRGLLMVYVYQSFLDSLGNILAGKHFPNRKTETADERKCRFPHKDI